MRENGRKVAWLFLFKMSALLFVGLQLYHLSVTQAGMWRGQADENHVRKIPIYSPRGVIFDRKGRSLSTSEPAFSAVLIDQDPKHVREIMPKLSLLLTKGDEVKAKEMTDRVVRQAEENTRNWRQFEPMPIARKLDPKLVATFYERRGEFQGVVLQQETFRNYPNGQLGGSLVGYVGQIGDELKDAAYSDYFGDEIVGKAGLELYYEKQLRGQHGMNTVMVDPVGRPLGYAVEKPPQPGHNLHLSLDMDLQRVAEQALVKQMQWIRERNDPNTPVDPIRGSLVVQDVRTGAILAMASVPTYDPNMMVKGLTEKQWAEIQAKPGFSMLNWGIQPFSPGSVYKMATGLAGLVSGRLGPYQQIECPGRYWRFGNPRNWNAAGQGPADIARALAVSCNPFFFETGYQTGIDFMSSFMGQLGFGKPTGIDLPDENPGVNPSKASYGDRWQEGEVINVAIGQGDVMVTPLQLANYTATIASNGVRHQPYLVSEVRDSTGKVIMHREPTVSGQVEASPEHLQRLQQGMRMAVTTSEGTAYTPFLGFPIPVAGKTGSAEVMSSGVANATSVAYAPYDKPEIAVSVIIQGGATGSWSTPVIRRVMAAYFGIKDNVGPAQNTYKE